MRASQNTFPAKIGIGYGKIVNLGRYRGHWPTAVVPLSDVAVIKAIKLDGTPLAVLFNYPLHPTVLKSQNRLFSADFVGCARGHLQTLLGPSVEPIYFNGAQGDIIPAISGEQGGFSACSQLGASLAEIVARIWKATEAEETLHIKTQKESYAFKPQATPQGLTLPLESYASEMT